MTSSIEKGDYLGAVTEAPCGCGCKGRGTRRRLGTWHYPRGKQRTLLDHSAIAHIEVTPDIGIFSFQVAMTNGKCEIAQMLTVPAYKRSHSYATNSRFVLVPVIPVLHNYWAMARYVPRIGQWDIGNTVANAG